MLIANSLLVPRWATWDEFRRLEALGLTMYGQMTAGSWIYIGTQGILQGTYQTFARRGREALRLAGSRGAHDPDRGARRDGRRAAARGDAGRRGDPLRRGRPVADPSGGSRRATSTRRPTRSTTRSRGFAPRRREGRALSVGLLGNAADVVPELARRGEPSTSSPTRPPPTTRSPATCRRGSTVDGGSCAARVRSGRVPAPRPRARSPRTSRRWSSTSGAGAYVFDYGNNLRGEAREAWRNARPSHTRASSRPTSGRSSAAASGRSAGPRSPGDPGRHRGDRRGAEGALPRGRTAAALARARARAGRVPGPAGADLLARLRRSREGGARDQRARPLRARVGARRDRARPPRLGLGRLAVPRDRGDARRLRRDRRLADPQRAAEHGGRRDVGQRPPRRRRRDRQLDPRGHGRRRRRQRRDGGATRARAHDRSRHRRDAPRRRGLRRGDRGRRARPASSRRCRESRLGAPAARPRPRAARVAGRARSATARQRARERRRGSRTRYVLLRGGADRGGRGGCATSSRSTATSRSSTGAGSVRFRGSSTATRTRASPATASTSSRYARRARRTRSCTPAGGGILSTVRATRAAARTGSEATVRRHRDWMRARRARRPSRRKSGYGLDRDTELASLRAIRAAGGVPTWLGAHAVPPEFDDDADAYLDFVLADVLPEAARARRGRRRVPRAGRLRRHAGASLPRGVPRRRPRAPPPRRPVHRVGRDPARDRARRALGRPPRGDRRRRRPCARR